MFFAIFAILYVSLFRISPQHRYIVKISPPSFSSFFPLLLSILLMKHIFLQFSLFRSYSIQSFFSCVLLSLSSPFYLFPLPFFAYPLLSLSVFLCVSSTFFLAAFYLFPMTFFVYHLIFLSASISFFTFYFPSWLSSTFILFLFCIIFPLLFSLSFRAFACYYYYYYHFCPSVLLFCIFRLPIFCLPLLLIFLLFSFSFLFLIFLFFPLSLIFLC